MNQEERLNDFIEQWNNSDIFHVFTSGSTGNPKEISIKKDRMIRSARRTNDFFGINKYSHLHSSISFEFIGGKMMIVRSLVADCSLTYETPSLCPNPPLDRIVDLMSVVPPQLPFILDNENEFSNVRNILIGGSAIFAELLDQIRCSKLNFWESYGMTETVSHIALRPLNHNQSGEIPTFYPLEGAEVILDEDDCLIIRDGDLIIKTNDLAKIFPDGGFLITGRKDDVIVTGAKKINALKLEQLLSPFISKANCEFFVTSRKHPLWTNELILAVKPRVMTDSNQLYSKLKSIIEEIPVSIIPSWSKPKEVLILDALPTTGSGKVKRNFLQ